MFHRLVSAQAVVNGGDLRQRKIRERDALVIGRKQNDVREHVANLADNLEQDCVLRVCHGSTRDPFRSASMIGCDAHHTFKSLWERDCTYALRAHPAYPTASETIGSVRRLLTEAR